MRVAKSKYAAVGHVTSLGQPLVLVSSHPPYMEVPVGFVPDRRLGELSFTSNHWLALCKGKDFRIYSCTAWRLWIRRVYSYHVPSYCVCGFLGLLERKLVTQNKYVDEKKNGILEKK